MVLPDGWWDRVWEHAREWDPGFCYWYGGMEERVDAACLAGRGDVVLIALALYSWSLVEYWCTKMGVCCLSRREVVALRSEVVFWEGLWGRWGVAVLTGPWDMF